MEILYVKSDKLMISLSGDVCGKENIEILCSDDKYTSHSKIGCLYKDKIYKAVIFNLLREKIRITVSGEEAEFFSLCGEENLLSLDLSFNKAGKNNIKIFLLDKEYINVGFEVCVENENYKKHFHDMKAEISRIAKPEILTYLKAECRKAGLEIREDSKTVCDMMMPLFERIIFAIHTENSRKYYSGNLFFEIKPKRKNINKFKSINIYNTKENRKIKSCAVGLSDFADKLIKLCEDEEGGIGKLRGNLKSALGKSAVLMADSEYESSKINISGSFFGDSADRVGQLYKFFCFAALSEILSKLYMPLESEIFSGEFDIYKSRQTKYINTENDNVITLTYNIAADKPAILMKINRKDRVTSHRRVYLFEPLYKENAGEYESDIAYKYKGMYEKGLVADVYALCFSKSGEYKNIISLSPYDRTEAEELIKSVLGDCDLNEYPPFEDAVCDADKEEFCRRDCLVAVVKTKSQFNINIKEKFYYIPARFIENATDIRYAALYQSRTLFGSEAGIKYFGEVCKVSLVPRYKISEISKNSDELYWRFDVKSWQTLENIIKPKDFAEVCMFTNIFLLKNAKELPELYINSFLEYILYCAEDEVNFRFENAYFKCRKDCITVYFKNGETVKFSRSAYKAAALKIEEMLKG